MDKEAAHRRLLQSIEYLKDNGRARNHEEISELSGISRPNVTSAINGNARYVTDGNLRKFARAYSDYINEDWLLTGEGKMEKADMRRFRPHIPLALATVSAGFMGTSIASVTMEECELRPVIPNLPSYNFTITVHGDSMEPVLSNRDVIACAWMESDGGIDPGKIYVVDSADGAVVKKIARTAEGLLCHSLNPLYKDFTVEGSDKVRIARVVGVVREL